MGMEKGERGIAARRKTWQSQRDAGAGLKKKKIHIFYRGTLVKFSDLQLMFCSPHTAGAVPKGHRGEPTWEGASVHYKTPILSVGKNWASLHFIPLSTAASVLEKLQPSFKVFQK